MPDDRGQSRGAFLTTVKDPLRGSHDRLHHLLAALSAIEETVVLSTNAWWLHETRETSPGGWGVSGGFPGVRVRVDYFASGRMPGWLQEFQGAIKAYAYVRKLAPTIHVTYHSTVAGLAAAVRCSKLGIPTAIDMADDLPRFYLESTSLPRLSRSLASEVAKQALGELIDRAELVTCSTRRLADTYEVPQKKTRVIPNGVDVTRFHPAESDWTREKIGLTDHFVVGYVGVLREWLDYGLIAEAFDILADEPIGLLVVGDGPCSMQLKRLADRQRGRAKVILTGPRDYAEIPGWINAIDVGLVPFKLNEMTSSALPLKVFEYLACGKPVISTPLRSVREALGNRVIYAGSAEELAERILDLRANQKAYWAFAEEGVKVTQERFNWRIIEAEFTQLFSELQET
jgi:glycosyltransferase involved in cell wall biosynthesis